jgi:ornithine decarboxylase
MINEQDDESFYIINLNTIISILDKWNKLLPNVKPFYAIKCNNDNTILNLLYSKGCNFDVASKQEIMDVLSITNNPDMLIFANPCKLISHILYAKQNGVKLLTFDCIEELLKIKEYYPESNLILRIKVDDSKSICKFNIKFGYDADDINIIFDKIKELNMNLVGFSFHVGSKCSSSYIYYDALKRCKKCYDISKLYNFNIEYIDIGGGFQYYNIDDIALEIKKGINDFFKKEEYDIKFIAEPGRLFVEESHDLILKIICKKKINDSFIYYVNDGIYGNLNCIHWDHYKPEIKIKIKNDNELLYNSTIFGPTCDSMDKLYDNILLQELNIGDIIHLKNMGAYTMSSSSSFNGFNKNIRKKYII